MWRCTASSARGADKLIQEFVIYEATDSVERRHSEIYGEMQHHGYTLPGAGELICSLYERGYEVWPVTSAKPEELDRHVEVLGVSERISGLVSSGGAEESKPAPEVFELALQRAGVEPGEAIAAGDFVWGIQAAARVRVKSVDVLSGGAFARDELDDAGARTGRE